jgi:hypothetical protein
MSAIFSDLSAASGWYDNPTIDSLVPKTLDRFCSLAAFIDMNDHNADLGGEADLLVGYAHGAGVDTERNR